jgi:hypothetical protein
VTIKSTIKNKSDWYDVDTSPPVHAPKGDGPMSDNAVLIALRARQLRAARISLQFPRLIGRGVQLPARCGEMALAHVIENKVEAAYRRGDLFDKRRKMMQERADYVGNEVARVTPVNEST